MSSNSQITLDDCEALIRDVHDFPKEGIVFKDITPMLASGPHFSRIVNIMSDLLHSEGVQTTALACPEARGFIFGSALASKLEVGFIPIRKPGKLPADTHFIDYELEYGTDRVEMHHDAIEPGQPIVLIDDLLATGGTIQACAKLIEAAGGKVAACVFLVELEFLNGRDLLGDHQVHSLIKY